MNVIVVHTTNEVFIKAKGSFNWDVSSLLFPSHVFIYFICIILFVCDCDELVKLNKKKNKPYFFLQLFHVLDLKQMNKHEEP